MPLVDNLALSLCLHSILRGMRLAPRAELMNAAGGNFISTAGKKHFTPTLSKSTPIQSL